MRATPADTLSAPRLTIQAVRLAEPVAIDGLLAEPVWQNGYGISRFTQRDPIEGAQPTEQTVVHVAYDDEAIYIGARMHDTAPDSIIARLGRRDADLTADAFFLAIDSYHDRRNAFFFGVNAAGTLYDGILFNDDWDDDSWDGVWEGKVRIDNVGWSAELRIPYSQLRFRKQDVYVWGINFQRNIARKNEEIAVAFTPKNGSGFVSRFPDLVGIENISPPRRIELLPYGTTRAEYTHPAPGNPFNRGSKYVPGMGADLKVGVGSNLTLNATVNPDFGQVEVDPAVVNLSDVETFFEEKRPFFIEGSSIFGFGHGGANDFWGFNWGDPGFFYSRRLGRAPQGSRPSADFADVPVGTHILGAAKLTGKVGQNWNLGTLYATTARETGEFARSGQQFQAEVEPLTHYGVIRTQKEFNQARQGLGLLSTLTARQFRDNRLRNDLNSGAVAVGVDGWTFLDVEKTWVVTGWAGTTDVHGTPARMIALQQNSQHYFQRPDASHVSVDSTATSLTGYAARFTLNKQKGNTFLNAAVGVIDPKFDTNDAGFHSRSDVINGHVAGGYKWVNPGRFTRYAQVAGAVFRSYDFDKNPTGSGVFHFGFVRWLNYYTTEWFFAYNPETIDNRQTRGGPLMLNLPGWEAEIFTRTDDRKTWVFGLGTSGQRYPGASWNWDVNPRIEWKPAPNVSFSVRPRFERNYEHAQWVGVYDDPLATATFGKRYVFATLSQTSLSARLRLDWTFTPKVSLQFYAQPLLSAGDYREFKELARPRSFAFTRYGDGVSTYSEATREADPDGPGPAKPIKLSNPDFNFKSLRGNAVFRWEYLPGSTLYLVWTQNRSDTENDGAFRLNRSLNRLLNAKAENVFMVKFAYWWNV
ncbi:MAG: carbohydrate binding family 9 domain-containing protein [Candidatus Latescibacteria bacterium]|nr:carbohydrate binding family 9 domain-containing protein [Candidatus Latescibacterota bacterium]